MPWAKHTWRERRAEALQFEEEAVSKPDAGVLTAERLSKEYRRGRRALADVTLSISAGGIVGLVGPNGAGKSTLIRTWVGFERPSHGRVTVCGVDPWARPGDALSHVGYVPQSPSLYEALTVDDHLAMAQQLRSKFDRRAAEQRLKRLGIPLEQRGGDLSGGQQAQVALALALGTGAEVLLLDEPLADLDPLARREFITVLSDAIRSSGATALLSSHIVTDIEQVCDRLLVLGVGSVLLDMPVEHALRTFATTREALHGGVEGFVGQFASPSGATVILARSPETVPDGWRRASLEEIVLGHLAAARGLPQPESAVSR